MKTLPILALAALLTVCGCGDQPANGPLAVSVIGGEPMLVDPARADPSAADAVLLGAVAQGLVRFDAQTQIIPGLAIRWAISDDGLYYTFRLKGGGPDAEQVARHLRRLVRKARSGQFATQLDPITDIVAVTPEVIEFRLSAPSNGLMTLLARPEFALLIGGRGSGPMIVDGTSGALVRLRQADRQPDEDRPILLRGERVGRAVARFADRSVALVTGGDFTNIFYPQLAAQPDTMVRIDPVVGLFGLRFARMTPLLRPVEIRQALSMSLDRDAIGEALGVSEWRSTQAILPPGITDLPQPTRPLWAQALANVGKGDERALAARRGIARKIIAQWRQRSGQPSPPVLRIAMPGGPGGRILFGELAAQWRAIGIDVRRADRDTADLRLIDIVAPIDRADWFIDQFACRLGPPCNEQADAALRAAARAADPDERARHLAEAEQKLAAITPFIPLAQPVRWSLAAPELAGFKPNARAIHPLAALAGD